MNVTLGALGVTIDIRRLPEGARDVRISWERKLTKQERVGSYAHCRRATDCVTIAFSRDEGACVQSRTEYA